MSKKKVGGGEPVVLLSTGAFSPIHRGHLQMMHQARDICAQRGQTVVGGVLSAGHDQYVRQKYGGSAFYPIGLRLSWMRQSIADLADPWLCVGHWEGLCAPVSLNFTDVCAHLCTRLNHWDIGAKVVYVFGSDNVGFAYAFKEHNEYVCVDRSEISSTLVRQGVDHGLSLGDLPASGSSYYPIVTQRGHHAYKSL